MDRESLAKDKFYSYYHKHHSISKSTNQLQQVKQLTKPTLKSGIIVTMCLSPCEECNGRYEDKTGQFKIQCHCNCHSNHNSPSEENKKTLVSVPAKASKKRWSIMIYHQKYLTTTLSANQRDERERRS